MLDKKNNNKFSRNEVLENIRRTLKQRFGNNSLHLLFQIQCIKNTALLQELCTVLCDENLGNIWIELLKKPEMNYLKILEKKPSVQNLNLSSDPSSDSKNDLLTIINIIRKIFALDSYQQPAIELDDDTKTMVNQTLSMLEDIIQKTNYSTPRF